MKKKMRSFSFFSLHFGNSLLLFHVKMRMLLYWLEYIPFLPFFSTDNLGTSQCSPLSGDTEPLDTRSKRQIPSHTDSGRPRKRLRRAHSNDSQSMSDPDDPEPEPEAETMPEALLEEDYQGPYLNVSTR